LDVCVDNGTKVAVIAVDTYHLSLPSGLFLELHNWYCTPSLSKNIISSSCLAKVEGYEFVIKNKLFFQFIIMIFSTIKFQA
jgi:hypothetical protein